MKQNGAVYYYITNMQGDVVRLVNAAGNTAAYYKYDPYGNAISASGSHATINPLRYRGYYYDTETGLYYCQSRYYDPAIGRFINADAYVSTGQGIIGCNMFAYCGNNPVSFIDTEGCFANKVAMCKLDEGVYVRHYGEGKAISLSIYNQSVYIDAYMTFDGGEIDPAILIQGIKQYWEGEYTNGVYTFNVFITIHQGKSSKGYTITVNSYNDSSRGYCTWNPFTWGATKESTVRIDMMFFKYGIV